eukprot:CAMPEP_0194294678 /NCGR_PEP_ID=MMETSP0169-20130528/51372_1 /TAXON_ID=218684 /ORGANISM="Corethron pennatum, Strain L29A3" /LENGTH=66 /DNA_ID=CAMNT_0039043617 /DNA_START=102 /DNA_END=298 /DNA_ORIENTATION=-
MSVASLSIAAFPTPYATLKVYDFPPNDDTRQINGGFGSPPPAEIFAVSIIFGAAATQAAYTCLSPT